MVHINDDITGYIRSCIRSYIRHHIFALHDSRQSNIPISGVLQYDAYSISYTVYELFMSVSRGKLFGSGQFWK